MSNEREFIAEDEIDLHELFSTLRDNISTIITITLISILLASAYIYWGKSIYSSKVIISLDSKHQRNSLGDLLGGAMLGNLGLNLGGNDSSGGVAMAKIILKSRKYLDSILDTIDNSTEYYIQRNFKKVEVDKFSNLKIDIKYKDEELYGEYFEIEPIDNKRYRLKVDAIDYNQIHSYGKEINNRYFTLNITKSKGIDPYDVIATEDNRVTQFIYNLTSKKKRYIFKTLDRDTRIDNLIDNITLTDAKDASNVLEITYKDTLPQRVKNIITTISNSFISYNLKNRIDEYNRNLKIINNQIKDINFKRKRKVDKLTKYQEKSLKTLMLSKGDSDIIGEMDKQEQSIESILLQIQEVKNFKNSLKLDVLSSVALTSAGIDTSSIQPLMDTLLKDNEEIRELELQEKNINKSITSNPLITSLIQDLKIKQDMLNTLLSDFTEDHPQVIKQKKEVADLIDNIRENIAINLKKLRKNRDIVKSNILTNMSMVEKSLYKKLKIIKNNIKKKKSLLHSMPAKNMINVELTKDFEFDEKIYTVLLQKKVETEISKSTIIANTKILEDAQLPKKPDSPKVALILVVSTITGIILGIFFVFFRAFLNKEIKNKEDIERITDIPIYGEVSKISNQETFTKQLEDIVTKLYFNSSPNRCTKIVISSMHSGEGKSLICSGLANIISQTEKKVLVIDLDLKESNSIGMIDYLSQKAELNDIIIKVDNFDFIPAGSIDSNIYLYLMNDRFKNMIIELEQRYDYIIFDTEAIENVPDTKVIMHYSDIVLLVAMVGVSQQQDIIEFDKIRVDSKIKSVGIILNKVKF